MTASMLQSTKRPRELTQFALTLGVGALMRNLAQRKLI